ncbi:unnamed protein product [Ectocarpus sp. CCAP 1310/34]|nr:unnamed protein product [Ectocarpus sp. CCAP 1310/34]
MVKRFDVRSTYRIPASPGVDLGPKRGDEKGGEWTLREAIGSMMHWDAIQKILGYLKGTRDLGITYQRGSGLGLAVYVDASYADTEDRRSVSGLATTVGGTVVSHGSKTQSIVSLSSTIQVLEDNQGAIALVQNPLNSGRTKHIDVRFHFIRALFRSGDISVKFVPATEQQANLPTKALSRASLQYHRRKLMNLPE